MVFMDLRHLQVFTAVVDTGSFTAAAEQLHIAQSAVSIAVKKLEQSLGLTLFDRTERRPRLTAEGELLIQRARQLLADFEQTRQQMLELKGRQRGTVRLGTSAMLGSYYLPGKIHAFRARHPQISFEVTGEGTNSAQARLLSGEIDMAVINLLDVAPELEVYPLVTEPVVACMALDHPLATRKAIGFAEFARQPLVLYGGGYYLRELVNTQCRRLDLSPDILLETNLLRLMTETILSQQALGIVLGRLTDHEPALTAVPFTEKFSLELGIAWRKGRYLSLANRAFADFLLADRESLSA